MRRQRRPEGGETIISQVFFFFDANNMLMLSSVPMRGRKGAEVWGSMKESGMQGILQGIFVAVSAHTPVTRSKQI